MGGCCERMLYCDVMIKIDLLSFYSLNVFIVFFVVQIIIISVFVGYEGFGFGCLCVYLSLSLIIYVRSSINNSKIYFFVCFFCVCAPILILLLVFRLFVWLLLFGIQFKIQNSKTK